MIRTYLRHLHSGRLATQLRRFAVVGTVAAVVQLALLWLFVDRGGVNYLVGAVVSIELTIVFQYVLNDMWTFEDARNRGTREFLRGLVRTNVVRGTAMPIQVGILFFLVEWYGLVYLAANAIAIALSGIYRYVLDARWTWGGDAG